MSCDYTAAQIQAFMKALTGVSTGMTPNTQHEFVQSVMEAVENATPAVQVAALKADMLDDAAIQRMYDSDNTTLKGAAVLYRFKNGNLGAELADTFLMDCLAGGAIFTEVISDAQRQEAVDFWVGSATSEEMIDVGLHARSRRTTQVIMELLDGDTRWELVQRFYTESDGAEWALQDGYIDNERLVQATQNPHAPPSLREDAAKYAEFTTSDQVWGAVSENGVNSRVVAQLLARAQVSPQDVNSLLNGVIQELPAVIENYGNTMPAAYLENWATHDNSHVRRQAMQHADRMSDRRLGELANAGPDDVRIPALATGRVSGEDAMGAFIHTGSDSVRKLALTKGNMSRDEVFNLAIMGIQGSELAQRQFTPEDFEARYYEANDARRYNIVVSGCMTRQQHTRIILDGASPEIQWAIVNNPGLERPYREGLEYLRDNAAQTRTRDAARQLLRTHG